MLLDKCKCTQIQNYSSYCRVNRDGHHKTNNISNRISETAAYKQIEEFIALLYDFIFGSLIRSQQWNKILFAHDLPWVRLRSRVKHRFGSIVFPIDDILKYIQIIHEFLMKYESENREYDTFRCTMVSFEKQREQYKQQTSQQPQKHSVSKPSVEAQRLLLLLDEQIIN